MISRKTKVKAFGLKIQNGPVGSVLSILFRRIMSDLNMDADRYDALMRRYIQKAIIHGGRKDRADARAGLSEELLKTTMTWKTFLKGLKFLGINRAEFTTHLTFTRHRFETHGIVFNLNDLDVETDGEDDKVLDEGEKVPGAILAVLYNIARESIVTSAEKEEQLMISYIKRTHFSIDKKNEGAIRASLIKELSRKVMTWKTFIKGLNFLGAQMFVPEVTLHHANERISKHRIEPVVIGELASEGD